MNMAICFSTDRYRPGIDYLAVPGRMPANERFAEAFALRFLMPASSVRERFHGILASSGDFQVADLCRLKHHFFVSLEAMTLRLEELGLVSRGTWDYPRSFSPPAMPGICPSPSRLRCNSSDGATRRGRADS